ncbi:hypothetical protein WA026_003737 [Henosepilachna vigintioctopunctata]|uniref:mRNA export factor GLE1 n=1 Tax=Henosepilachna vigintioctopunctata TaxID=420089 RepID=A0AAW1UD69_9CUCU
MQSVDELFPHLEDLKISAFRKAILIKNAVHDVTIGPNSNSMKHVESNDHNFHNNTSSDVKNLTKQSSIQYKRSSQEILPFPQILKEIEYERQKDVRSAVEYHVRKFEIFDEQQQANRKQQWILTQQKHIKKIQDQEQAIKCALKEYDSNKSIYNNQLALFHQELEEQRKKSAELLELKKKEKQLLSECLAFQKSFHIIYHDILMTIKNCQGEIFKDKLQSVCKECKELNDFMSSLISKLKSTNVTVEDRQNAEIILIKINNLKTEVNGVLLQKDDSNEQQMKQKETASNVTSSSTNSQNTIATDSVQNIAEEDNVQNIAEEDNVQNIAQDQTSNNTSLEDYVSKSSFKFYSDIMAFYGKYTETLNELIYDNQYKEFRFDCKKAINLTVNAISAVSSEHIRDKYVKLYNLIKGQNVVIGDFQINASKHPKGIQYCIDLLANKFVLQGDLMISSKPEAAFSFATIIISLWNECPEFGKLLLAYFFKECPYLVPIYIPKMVDQTDEEFYKGQGYKYIDGKVERQDKFLKRMTGIMRLYFAILISHPKQGQNGNPHNIKIAWSWLASVLKLQPRIDITATMLHTFLETVGYEMQNHYKMQFFKLLRFLIEKYIPSLKRIDNGGPVVRLECLIQEFKENKNHFKAPNSRLSQNFW